MTIFSDAVRRSRAATARTVGVPWRILPRIKHGDERPVTDASRLPFDVSGHLFAPDKVDGRVTDITAFETARAPGIVGDDLALTVWENPTGGVIRHYDLVQELLPDGALGRTFRINRPPGGDATGHVRLDLTALQPRDDA